MEINDAGGIWEKNSEHRAVVMILESLADVYRATDREAEAEQLAKRARMLAEAAQ